MSSPGAGRVSNPGGNGGRLIYSGNAGPMVSRTGRGSVGGGYVAPPVVSHPYNHGNALIVPYPVFYGGYYYGYDAPPAPQAGGYYYDPSGAQQVPPVAIINQGYQPETINPSFQDYSNVDLPPPSTLRRYDTSSPPYQNPAPQAQNDQPSTYLIAMKDHTIYAAIGYWTEGETLHYITTDNIHNNVSLDLVDRAFTKQLNDERHIEFRLPPEK